MVKCPCGKNACFNYIDNKPIYCSPCKKDGMVDVKNKRCEKCSKRPVYNFEGAKNGRFCVDHREDGMVDVKHKRCVTPLCDIIVGSSKYDGYCLFCYIHLFPDKPVSRNYKTKEMEVVNNVNNTFPEYNWIFDKIISGGCSRRRPDIFLDLGYQVLIVEVDENQHIDYDCSCENKRLMELSRDVGHRSIVFIRFNPDQYDNVTSCWGYNKNGLATIKKTKKTEWSNRLNVLNDQIRYWIENKTTKIIEVVELFYDST